MVRRLFLSVSACLVSLCTASAAAAQGNAPPPDSLAGILREAARLAFEPNVLFLPTDYLSQVPTLGALTALEVATAPIGTSTGGFTYTFDPTVGTSRPITKTFGPTFAERSLTTGERGKMSVGFTYLHAGYDRLAGMHLRNGDLHNVENLNDPLFAIAGLPPVNTSSVKLEVSSQSLVGLFVYALRDDIDIGVVAPWVRVSMSGTSATFTATGEPLTDYLPVIPETSRAGIGEISLFGKMRLWKLTEGGLAGAFQLTLPTGDPDNLRGLGVTRALFSAIWSTGGTLAPHASAGYEFWSSEVKMSESSGVAARNQFKYAFGVEWLPHDRASVTLDVVGRRLLGGGRLEFQRFVTPSGLGTVDVLLAQPKGFSIAAFAPGVKYNIWGDALLTGNMLISLASHGMRANVTAAVGIDWFIR